MLRPSGAGSGRDGRPSVSEAEPSSVSSSSDYSELLISKLLAMKVRTVPYA
jgi:hypothetical protein